MKTTKRVQRKSTSKNNPRQSTRWVDYRELKARVNVLDVLKHFHIGLPGQQGTQFYGPCPLPEHGGDRDNNTSFSVSSEKNAWRCLSHCGSGNVIDLFAQLSERDPSDKDQFRQAALEMQEVFSGASSQVPPSSPAASENEEGNPRSTPKTLHPNTPLSFTLQVKHDIPFLLQEKKLDLPLLKELGIGWAAKGMFAGRVVIPIHNASGELVAYAGRGLKENDIQKRGKYLFPKSFHKSLELFNQHRAAKLVEPWGFVVVVEGFFGALRWHQVGIPVVALMGSEMSKTQMRLLAKFTDTVWLMLDNDEPGQKAATKILPILAEYVFARRVLYPYGESSQPEDFTPEELLALIRG